MNCKRAILVCNDCNKEVERGHMQQHKESECFTWCPYAEYGCVAPVLCMNLERHLQRNKIKHLQLKVNVSQASLKESQSKVKYIPSINALIF